jgi:hypothetical protein
MDSRRVITTQTSLAWSRTAWIQLVSSDTHANAIGTIESVLFLRVNAFLSSRMVYVHHPACTGQNLTESMLRGGLKLNQPILSLSLKHWNKKPAPAQSKVFMFQVAIFHATNPDTPFVVTATSFSDLRDKTEDELEAMLEVIEKLFIKKFPDGKGITCFYSGLEVVPLFHAGFAMLSFDQGTRMLLMLCMEAT